MRVMADSSTSAMSRFRSGRCVIDLARREIERDGVAIAVEAKVFDLIAILVRHADRAVGKREINDVLWPERPVTDAALSQLLRKARRALGDDGTRQQYIRTVHAHGLQWVALLEPLTQPAADNDVPAIDPPPTRAAGSSGQRRRVWWIASTIVAGLVALAVLMRSAGTDVAAESRIVILPVVDHSGEPDLEWTSHGLRGLMAGIVRDQAQLDVVTSPERTGSDHAIDPTDPRTLTRLRDGLGATHVLRSELRRIGSIYELDMHLINLRESGDYHRVMRGSAPAELATDLALSVRDRLQGRRSNAASALAADIQDPFVAEVYARGLDAQHAGDFAAARKYFEICLDHDGSLLWPRLQLAISQTASGDIDEGAKNAQQVATMADDRDLPALRVEALRHLASIEFRRGEMDAAQAWLDQARAALPVSGTGQARVDLLVAYGSIDSERGRLQASRGHFQEALTMARALGDRGREASALVNLAVVDNAAGDADAAIRGLRQALDAARVAGNGTLEAVILLNLGGAQYNAGHPLDAAALLRQTLVIATDRSDRSVRVLASAVLSRILASYGRVDDARRLADAVSAAGKRDGNPLWQAEGAWALASLASSVERWDDALAYLAEARERFETGGMMRNAADVLADVVQVAGSAGRRADAEAAATDYRAIADSEQTGSTALRLPLIEAQLRHANGDTRGATDAMLTFLSSRQRDRDRETQAAILDVARWQLELGEAQAVLDQPALDQWMAELPEAIELRLSALAMLGRHADVDALRGELDALKSSPNLDIDPALIDRL